ncbi:hypothetical protein CPHO_09050 [Corynebacterium phocae]|uniref:Uncharacterized protein n=1 Tax=Corynebacterium phocae TaxID=161895 RepID=A0A1L7D4C9_9CORY|nr:YeeE/YedE thiosulfate transporter family protein [Corynebacterium phocae]APT93009.1 hypothetical protein CPHO_09050 [Corynebacterium phocae]
MSEPDDYKFPGLSFHYQGTGRNSALGATTPSADTINLTASGEPDRVTWGTLLVIGLLPGAYFAAKDTGEFRIRVPDASTAVRAIFGGTFMGVGLAPSWGCASSQSQSSNSPAAPNPTQPGGFPSRRPLAWWA